jgi:hypothetical protein
MTNVGEVDTLVEGRSGSRGKVVEGGSRLLNPHKRYHHA